LLATFAMAACAGADSFPYPSRLTPRDRSGAEADLAIFGPMSELCLHDKWAEAHPELVSWRREGIVSRAQSAHHGDGTPALKWDRRAPTGRF